MRERVTDESLPLQRRSSRVRCSSTHARSLDTNGALLPFIIQVINMFSFCSHTQACLVPGNIILSASSSIWLSTMNRDTM